MKASLRGNLVSFGWCNNGAKGSQPGRYPQECDPADIISTGGMTQNWHLVGAVPPCQPWWGSDTGWQRRAAPMDAYGVRRLQVLRHAPSPPR